MAPTFLNDLDVVDESTIELPGPTYPVAQWLNGDPKLAAAGGVAHTGGLILPLKYLDDNLTPTAGWTKTTVAFSSGAAEEVLAAQKPRLAVVRTRFRWFVVYNGVTTFYPRPGYVSDAGMRGHLQALCAVHGFDFPVMGTFKGKASQEFERILREFTQRLQDGMQRAARDNVQSGYLPANRRFPRFAFYMKLAAGAHVRVGPKGQDSLITPPTLDLPRELNDDALNKLYVGRERLIELQNLYHEAAEWAAAWDKPGAEETFEEHDAEPETATPEFA
ncbi:MAG: hypothetical protein ACRDH2_05455 [Anaerolineales bacterium]